MSMFVFVLVAVGVVFVFDLYLLVLSSVITGVDVGSSGVHAVGIIFVVPSGAVLIVVDFLVLLLVDPGALVVAAIGSASKNCPWPFVDLFRGNFQNTQAYL